MQECSFRHFLAQIWLDHYLTDSPKPPKKCNTAKVHVIIQEKVSSVSVQSVRKCRITRRRYD